MSKCVTNWVILLYHFYENLPKKLYFTNFYHLCSSIILNLTLCNDILLWMFCVAHVRFNTIL